MVKPDLQASLEVKGSEDLLAFQDLRVSVAQRVTRVSKAKLGQREMWVTQVLKD